MTDKNKEMIPVYCAHFGNEFSNEVAIQIDCKVMAELLGVGEDDLADGLEFFLVRDKTYPQRFYFVFEDR